MKLSLIFIFLFFSQSGYSKVSIVSISTYVHKMVMTGQPALDLIDSLKNLMADEEEEVRDSYQSSGTYKIDFRNISCESFPPELLGGEKEASIDNLYKCTIQL